MIKAPGRTIYTVPDTDASVPVVAALAAAKSSVSMIAYSLSLPAIVDTLIAKHQAGLTVQIVADLSETLQPFEAPEITQIKASGVPITIGVSPKAHAIVHTKMILIDGALAIYGSANWTRAGLVYEENIVVFDRTAAVVKGLEAYFAEALAAVAAHPKLEEVV